MERLQETHTIMSSVKGARYAEQEIQIALAGRLAQRRAFRGSDGWRRHRTPDQVRAFHEAGHAVVAHLVGWYVFDATIEIDPSMVVGNGNAVSGGCVIVNSTPKYEPLPKASSVTRVASDRQNAARFAFLLGCSWRGALKVIRRLRADVMQMIEENWSTVDWIALALLQKRTLARIEIDGLLRSGSGSARIAACETNS